VFDTLDNRLADWVRQTLDGVFVSLAPPGGSDPSGAMRGVNMYLIELIQNPPARGARRPAIQLILRYLVTTWAAKPEEAHEMLGTLFVKAASDTQFEIEQEPLPISMWQAFGIGPRPAFVVRVPFRHELPEKIAPQVTKPLVVRQSPMGSLSGTIHGPGSIPIAEARVELPSLSLHTYTDYQGRFQFATVPAEPRAKLLLVRAKGRDFSITADQAGPEGGPLLIELQLEG